MYLRVPSSEEQHTAEFKLDEHLAWYKENGTEADKVPLGSWDVPIDARGVPISGKRVGEVGTGRASTEMALGELLGGKTDADPIPFWLQGGKRLVPNISDFKVPDYAVFADRSRRHTGLALVASFPGGDGSGGRRFVVTTDLRLAPSSKLKPDTGSAFHGVELGEAVTLPVAFVRTKGAHGYKVDGPRAEQGEDLEWRSVHALTGKVKTVAGVKYFRTKDKRWLHQDDVGVAVAPASWPEAADKGEKWVEISIENQTLVLWEGKRPVYATLVSTGRDGMKDPKKTLSTIRGVFRIKNKHITATMDSNESSAVGGRANTSAVAKADPDDAPGPRAKDRTPKDKADKAAKGKKDPKAKDPKKDAKKDKAPKEAKAAPKDADAPKEYVPKKGDGQYGVTKRRGEGTFQLRDVPYIQYFESGYAIHGAYWHDVFGTPRSHGCINLAPIDAHRVFLWTEPAVPDAWHAMNTGPELGEGTVVIVHE
jgi:lipoprotein-anchoring transpeptidase ErfK/SrfK